MNLRFLYSCILILIATMSFYFGFLANGLIHPMFESADIEKMETQVNRANLHVQFQDYRLDFLKKEIYHRDKYAYSYKLYWDKKNKIWREKCFFLN